MHGEPSHRHDNPHTSSTPIDNIWKHYRTAVSRVGKNFTIKERRVNRRLDDEENLGYEPPAVPNRTSQHRYEGYGMTVKQRHSITQTTIDYNCNRFSDGRCTRVPPLEFTRQLSLDLEDARHENGVLKQMLLERANTIAKLVRENDMLQKKVERLSAGRGGRRSQWMEASASRTHTPHFHNKANTPLIDRPRTPDSSIATDVPPKKAITPKPAERHHSVVTYSSSDSLPTSTPIRSFEIATTPVSRREKQKEASESSSSSATPVAAKATPKQPMRISTHDMARTPAYYLRLHRPEFILHCERRQTAIRVAAEARNRISDDKRAVARAVVEGKASIVEAKPFLNADPTTVKAFDVTEMRAATMKKLRSTSEYQSRVKERNDKIDRAANKLIAHCFSTTLPRSISIHDL